MTRIGSKREPISPRLPGLNDLNSLIFNKILEEQD